MTLFDATCTEPDIAFAYLRDATNGPEAEARALIDALWPIYQAHADRNFPEQFARDVDPRFWEMYLTCTLIEAGLDVSCPKPGPDVLVRFDSTPSAIWIEATAPTRGEPDAPDSVPEPKYDGVPRYVPDDQIILRYRSAIWDKFKKFSKYEKDGLVRDEHAQVIAINACRIPSSRRERELPRIVRAVFPIGNEAVVLNRETTEVVRVEHLFRPSVEKHSGEPVATDIFTDPFHASLSAVLFSNVDTVNRPDGLGDDFVLVHNPMATNPLPLGLIPRGREYTAEEQPDGSMKLVTNSWLDGGRDAT